MLINHRLLPRKGTVSSGARERTQLAVKRFQAAQVELERVCQRLGCAVPEMVC